MPDAQSGPGRAAAKLHRGMKATADAVGILLVDGFHYLALFSIGATTVWSALAAFISMVAKGRAELSDILLLFIYLEIGAMVGIYFKTTRLPVRYLIYIAMTEWAGS
jgi:protein PsiE